MMVKAGLTPMQTIVAATGGAAKVMKLDQNLGTIAPGKQADLLVLNANPLTDIKNTRQIHSVWIGGRRLPDMPALNTAHLKALRSCLLGRLKPPLVPLVGAAFPASSFPWR